MNEEFDFYLNRKTKIWAAQFNPSSDVKARLLQEAASPVPSRKQRLSYMFSSLKSWLFGRQVVYLDGEWIVGPYAYSNAWSLHFATNWRLAF